ncbi:MAG: hypothetical protein ACOCYT_00855 [Chloroflexota bacterium]
MKNQLRADAQTIADFLYDHLTEDGLREPDSGVVLNHTYSTEWFAWACALLYRQTGEERWVKAAVKATHAALNMQATWYANSMALGSKPTFPWEFKNLALLHVEQLISTALPEKTRNRLREALRNWRDLDIDTAMWTTLRLVTYTLRADRFRKPGDRRRAWLERTMLLGMQTPEGFFPDQPDSFSLQYHAYILALLALHHRQHPTNRIRRALLKGVRLAADFINPEGDFNYYGRGQRQLAGYAALVLALAEAARQTGEAAEAHEFMMLAQRVRNFIMRYVNAEKGFPIVLGDSPVKAHYGWYEYNNQTDYLALCAVMFLLTIPPPNTENITDTGRPPAKPAALRCYPDIGLAVADLPDRFAVFAAGRPDESEPCGLVHLWPDGPFCLGGPDIEWAVGRDYSNNYLGPVVNKRPLVHRRPGRLAIENGKLVIHSGAFDLSLTQTVNLEDGLTIDMAIHAENAAPRTIQLAIPGEHPLPGATVETIDTPLGAGKRTLGAEEQIGGQQRDWAASVTLLTQPDSASNAAWEVIRGGRETSAVNAFSQRVLKSLWVLMVMRLRRRRRVTGPPLLKTQPWVET